MDFHNGHPTLSFPFVARIARVVVPGIPHHVIQRGNRRQRTFFSPEDYHTYLDLMAAYGCPEGLDVWAYCLMPNHVHLIVVPQSESSLSRGIGEAHRRYSRAINIRHGWTGHLWQGRFLSYPMDEEYLHHCVRYILLNPVNAKLAKTPHQWPHSSARAHVKRTFDPLINPQPLAQRILDWEAFLKPNRLEDLRALKNRERTGRPLGSDSFVARLEEVTGRILRKQKPGPKPSKS